MELLQKISREPALRVRSYSEIKDEAERLIVFFDTNNGKFEGNWKDAYALHACQVGYRLLPDAQVRPETAWNYFVPSKNISPIEQNLFQKLFSRPDNGPRFRARVIINPEILEKPDTIERMVPIKDFAKGEDGKVEIKFVKKPQIIGNIIQVDEACMSYPNRTKRKVDRHYRIKVRYQTKGLFGLKTHEEWIEGLLAHIFQHEYDHALGEVFYFKDKHTKQ